MDKIILTEKQILTTIRLSGVQKTLLAKITAAATPEVAYEQISDGRNFVANRDTLQRLGLIDFEEGSANVTEAGKKVMRDENLMDDSEQLTQDGQQYVQVEDPNDITRSKSGTAAPDAGKPEGMGGEDDLGLGGEDDGDEPNLDGEQSEDNPEDEIDKAFEGISLIQSMNHQRLSGGSDITFSGREVRAMTSGGNLSIALMDKIYEFVVEHDPLWMPYGTQKARTGDPQNWIADNLDDIASVINQATTK